MDKTNTLSSFSFEFLQNYNVQDVENAPSNYIVQNLLSYSKSLQVISSKIINEHIFIVGN